MDDFFDGCGDGCADGCLDFEFAGCIWWGKSDSGPSDADFSSSRGKGYAAGVVAGEVADAVAESDPGDDQPGRRAGRHAFVKPERTVLRVVVWVGYKEWLDKELVEFGRNELKIVKINRYGLSMRLRFRWSTCWVIAFCAPKQERALRRRLQELQREFPERIKHYK